MKIKAINRIAGDLSFVIEFEEQDITVEIDTTGSYVFPNQSVSKEMVDRFYDYIESITVNE